MLSIEFTKGTILFYGGIVGMLITLGAGVVAALVMGKSRKRLKHQLDRVYIEE